MLEVWLAPGMDWFAAPDGRPGRPLRFSAQAIEFCLTLKGLFERPLRQVTSLTQSLHRMARLDFAGIALGPKGEVPVDAYCPPSGPMAQI